MPPSRAVRAARGAAVALLAGAVLGGGTLAAVGWWIDSTDEPAPADLAVVLAGGIARPLYAADLYAQGLAREFWLSRPVAHPAADQVRALGVNLPREEDSNREVLLKKGVPADRIRLYGRSVLSTVDEAVSLRREADLRGKKILVVTSRFHARRARLIFRRHCPEAAEIRVAASPYDGAPKRWWTDNSLAQMAILEMFKTAYFLVGGKFVSAPS